MYRAYHLKYENNTWTRNLFFDTSTTDDKLVLTSAILNLRLNMAGEFRFTAYPNNTEYDHLIEALSYIEVYRDEELIFHGRIYSVAKQLDLSVDVECEGSLTYFNDSVFRPDTYQCTMRELVQAMLDSHNNQVGNDKKIFMGNYEMDGNVYREYEDFRSTMSRLSDLHETFGGYMSIRKSGNSLYFDWVHDLEDVATQSINFGTNMLNLVEESNLDEIATVLIPIGADYEEGDGEERTTKSLTIESVNQGRDYIEADSDAIAQFGRIVATVKWDDVTEPQNLYNKGVQWLANHCQRRTKISVSALDMSYISKNVEAWRLGEKTHVNAEYHHLSEDMLCTSLSIDLLSPANSNLVLGSDVVGFVEAGGTRLNGVMNSVENLKGVLYQDYIKAHVIETDYLKTKELESESAKIGLLTADSAIIDEVTARDLVVKNENVEKLLAGEAGVGTLQAIHLSSANTVIADATIVDAMIASLRANKITAGTIYTNLVNIADAEGHLNLDGSTIQIKDNNDVVRVQIGYDGTDYSFYLWGADGQLLWQPNGITGEGIGSGKVKDFNVAENAGIKGSKLDIESVGQALNGSTYVIDASKVMINDSTLSAQYQQIITDIKGLQGQISGDIDTFFGDDVPTLENYPFTEWQNEVTKNLLPFPYFDNVGLGNPRVINGITWTLNTDGSVTANGKANGISKFTLQSYADGRSLMAGTYAISGCPEGGSNSTFFMRAQILSANSETTAVVGRAKVGKARVGNGLFDNWVTDFGEGAVGTLEDDSVVNIEIAVANGKTVENLTFYPQLERGNEVTDYQTANKYMKRIGDVYIVGADGGEYAGKTFRFIWDSTNCVFYWQQLSDNEISDLYNKVTTLETNFDVIQGQINSKVWQTDIDYSVSQITDQYTQLTQTVNGINVEVGNLKTSAGSFNTRITKVEQTAEGLSTRVTATEQYGSRITTAETQIVQNATNIGLKLTATDFNGVNIATKINASADYVDITTNKFRIKAGSIDINSGNFKVDTNGNLYCSNVDLTGKINATSGTFRGTVYASAGEFTGKVTATSGSFTGTVNASSGTFRGTVYASAGEFTGKVTATSGSFTGSITTSNASITGGNISINEATETSRIQVWNNNYVCKLFANKFMAESLSGSGLKYSSDLRPDGFVAFQGAGSSRQLRITHALEADSRGGYYGLSTWRDIFGNATVTINAKSETVWANSGCSSDMRQKNLIEEITDFEASTLLTNVKPINYTWIRKPEFGIQSGFSAQNIRNVLKDNGIGYRGYLLMRNNMNENKQSEQIYNIDVDESAVEYGLDYSHLVSILWKGWQMHEAKIKELEAQLGGSNG